MLIRRSLAPSARYNHKYLSANPLATVAIFRRYTTQNSPLIDIISHNKPLTNESKKYFRDYWKSLNSSNQIPEKLTLLKQIPIHQFITFIQNNRKFSSTIRGAYRRELIFNYSENLPTVKILLKSLGLTFESTLTGDQILSLSVYDSLRTKDVIIAADLYTLYYKLHPNEPLNEKICAEIISALAFENPKYDHFHLLKYLELQKIFEYRGIRIPLSEIQLITLCNKALSLENEPILIKEILTKLMDIESIPTDPLRKNTMTAAYHVIQNDYKINNVAGVLIAWTSIKNEYISITHHDPRILYKILKIFTHNKAYRKHLKQILDQLPPEYYCNHPLILPSLIDYATKTGNLTLAQTVMDNVNKHIYPQNTQVVLFSKRCLSSLLRMHLKFKDSEGVDRVLKQILEIFGKHSEENLFAVISHLVSVRTLENLNKAIQLVNSIPQNRALLAYAAIINKIIEWQIASDGRFHMKSLSLMNEMLVKAHDQDPNHRSSLWTIVASLFVKQIVHHRNFQRNLDPVNPTKRIFDTACLDLAKHIYIKSDSKDLHSSMTDKNPFISSSPHRILIRLTNNNKVVILRNIALSAIKGKRKDIFLWCCSELYNKGIPVKELLADWNIMLKHKLRSAQFSSKKHLEDQLLTESLPLISKVLK